MKFLRTKILQELASFQQLFFQPKKVKNKQAQATACNEDKSLYKTVLLKIINYEKKKKTWGGKGCSEGGLHGS